MLVFSADVSINYVRSMLLFLVDYSQVRLDHDSPMAMSIRAPLLDIKKQKRRPDCDCKPE
jgi:hypothetical protein